MRRIVPAFIVVLLLGGVIGYTVHAQQGMSNNGVPEIVTYRGYLEDSSTGVAVPVSGTKSMTFKIYEAATGGSSVWTCGPTNISVLAGHFEVPLGASPCPAFTTATPSSGGKLFNSPALYLEIAIAGTTLTSRQRITSSPYAIASSQSNNFRVNGTLGVDGATTLAGASATSLSVSGMTTLAATSATTLSVSSTSTHTGLATFAGGISVTGGSSSVGAASATTLSVSSTSSHTGLASFAGGISVTGGTSALGTATASSVSTSTLSVSSTSSHTGLATFGGGISVTGGTGAIGAATASSLTVSGATTLNGTIALNGNISTFSAGAPLNWTANSSPPAGSPGAIQILASGSAERFCFLVGMTAWDNSSGSGGNDSCVVSTSGSPSYVWTLTASSDRTDNVNCKAMCFTW